MANAKIEEADISSEKILAPNSRYLKQKVIYYGEQRRSTFNTYRRVVFTPSESDKMMVITKGVEYRPDLVSFDQYGFVDLWWKILEVNKMKDIFEFEAGKNIILPANILE